MREVVGDGLCQPNGVHSEQSQAWPVEPKSLLLQASLRSLTVTKAHADLVQPDAS